MVKISDSDHPQIQSVGPWPQAYLSSKFSPNPLLKYLIYSADRLTGKRLIRKGGKLSVRAAMGSLWRCNVNSTVSTTDLCDLVLCFKLGIFTHTLYFLSRLVDKSCNTKTLKSSHHFSK